MSKKTAGERRAEAAAREFVQIHRLEAEEDAAHVLGRLGDPDDDAYRTNAAVGAVEAFFDAQAEDEDAESGDDEQGAEAL